MMFENEIDARQKIPRTLLSDPDFFNSNISKNILDMTKFKTTDEAIGNIFKAKLDTWTRREKHCLWLALVYAYPDLNDNFLLMFSGYFRLSTRDSIVLAAAYGRETYFDRFIQENRASMLSLNLGDLGAAVNKATANNHKELNQRLADFMNIISDKLTAQTGYLPSAYRFRLFQEPDENDKALHAPDDAPGAASSVKYPS